MAKTAANKVESKVGDSVGKAIGDKIAPEAGKLVEEAGEKALSFLADIF